VDDVSTVENYRPASTASSRRKGWTGSSPASTGPARSVDSEGARAARADSRPPGEQPGDPRNVSDPGTQAGGPSMVRATLALVCCLSAVSLAQEPPAAPLPPEPQAPAPASGAPDSGGMRRATAPTPTGEPGADWSLRSGQTMGQDQSAVAGQAGWPGILTEYIYGIRPFLDPRRAVRVRLQLPRRPGGDGAGDQVPGASSALHLFDAGKLVFSVARFERGFLAFFSSKRGPAGPDVGRSRRPPGQKPSPGRARSDSGLQQPELLRDD
jgi:hypothetical protein